MWFKNLVVFRIDAPWTLTATQLEERLARRPLLPCSGLSLQSSGWLPPLEDGVLVQSLEKHLLIALGTEQKLLPASVVNEEVKARAAALEQQKGHKPGRKVLRDLKDQVTAELLPRAFARRSTLLAWVDPTGGRIVINTSSLPRAEALIQQLRDALGSLAVLPLQADTAPAFTMTQWLLADRVPGRFALEDECELSGGDASRPVVRYLRHPLAGAKLKRHLDAGMQATRLALSWNAQVGFVLSENLQIKRVSFLDMDKTAAAEKSQNPDAEFEAEFALMTGTLGRFLGDLEKLLGLK